MMRKLPKLSRPIAEMDRLQLVRLAAWLIGEQYFSISLGKGNSLDVTLGWVSDNSVDVDDLDLAVGNGATLDLQPLQDLIRGYHQRIKDVCKRLDELGKQSDMRQFDFVADFVDDAVEGRAHENRSH